MSGDAVSESASAPDRPFEVLFVCLGNICRSPTAHGVFEALVRAEGLEKRIHVRSGGTGSWHVGEPPDARARLHARRRGYEIGHLRAAQVSRRDFARADLILAMDRANLGAIREQCAAGDAGKARLFLDFLPELPIREVPDPYYGEADGFERVLDLVEAASRSLLSYLRQHRAL
jgi:protein-tyrosine phosphatase